MRPDPAIAAAFVRAWLHRRVPHRIRYRPRSGIRRYAQAAALRAQGLPYKDIADVMGISVGNVGNYLRYARTRRP